MRRKWMKKVFIFCFIIFFGCSLDLSHEEPLSNYFDWFNYFLTIRRNSIRLQIYDLSGKSPPTLDYRVGPFEGRLIGGRELVLDVPLQDSLIATWYNAEMDSLTVPLYINKSVFDSMPFESDSIVNVFHPGDTPSEYLALVDWTKSENRNGQKYWIPCGDTPLKRIPDSLVLRVSESSNFAPPSECYPGRVRMFQYRYDTLNYAIVYRLYEIYFQSSGIDN